MLVPAYNEELNVERAYRTITDTFAGLPGYDYEIIVTDNHSTDGTFGILKRLATQDDKLKVMRFSRNYGYQRSLLMAYKAADGDCSVQIDCDLQDPPELIGTMLQKWQEGHEVVYGIRRTLADGPVTRALRRGFYWFIARISDDDLPLNAGEFRLVDRRLLDELRKVDDATPYLRGMISAMGFSQVGFEYDRQDRIAGHSKFPLRAMIGLAMDGVLNHSLVPLRIASLIGLTVGAISLLLTFGYLVGRLLLGQIWPAGFATTTILLLVSLSLNALFLGIMGEYLGRLFVQAKHRSSPLVQASLNYGKPRSGEERRRPAASAQTG